MPLWAFLLYSALGTTVWVGVLTFAGYQMGEHYTALEASIGLISKTVLAAFLLAGGAFWARRRRLKRLAQQG